MNITVISFSFQNWSREITEKIKNEFSANIEWIDIPAEKKPLLPWIVSSFLQKTATIITVLFPTNIGILAQFLNKRHYLIKIALAKVNKQPHLIIAHNPGTFYAALNFAKKNCCKLGIDVEDYHPGEAMDIFTKRAMLKYIQRVLPQADYVSAASPLILQRILDDTYNKISNPICVLNFFQKQEFIQPISSRLKQLRLIWFSQYIDKNRGLELLLQAIKGMEQYFDLHLIGHLNQTFSKEFILGVKNISIHQPLPQKQLHTLLSDFDVGLALEDSNANDNRNICLTNKILSYFQAGLYILATTTAAQKKFIEQHPNHGCLVQPDLDDIRNMLMKLYFRKQNLRDTAVDRFQRSSFQHSQTEMKKIEQIWSTLLGLKINSEL